jgi:hypothetical protein
MTRRLLTATAALGLLLGACDLIPSSGGIEFPPVGDLWVEYGTLDTAIAPVTLLAEGGAPQGGYTWTLAPGSQYPSGLTVDQNGVFQATGPRVLPTSGTFKMKVTAGSNSATSPSYRVRVRNWGTGPVPTALFQQWDPYGVDPSALELIDGKAGEGYGASLYVTGGTPPYRWAEDLSYAQRTSLASVGLAIHATKGVVWGEPFSSASGKTVRFRVIVTDAENETAIYQPVYTIHIE